MMLKDVNQCDSQLDGKIVDVIATLSLKDRRMRGKDISMVGQRVASNTTAIYVTSLQ
jgi:hypothetical protein